MKYQYRLACCVIVLIVFLRIGIGWHFLYEGVHKFDPAAGFSSEGFLGTAKGPTAELYYWMLPDLEGIQRVVIADIKDENERDRKTFIVYEEAWKEYFREYLTTYFSLVKNKEEAENIVGWGTQPFTDWVKGNVPPAVKESIADMNAAQLAVWAETKVPLTDTPKDDDVEAAKMLVRAKTIFNRYLNALRAEAADSEKDVDAFLKSRERFLKIKRTIRNSTSFEQERRWNTMLKYRAEAAGWTKLLNEMGNGLQSDLGRLIDPELAGQRGQIVTAPMKALIPPNSFIQMDVPENPYAKSRMDVMDLAVMFGLSAIGLCMILGFCTRLACLGGAAFLVNVILTTFPVPGIYPEMPSMVGNFMFVSKDVVELLALLFLAAIPSGRWGGLDYFLWHCGGKQIAGLVCPCCISQESQGSKKG